MKSWRYRDLSCILQNSQSLGHSTGFAKNSMLTICLMFVHDLLLSTNQLCNAVQPVKLKPVDDIMNYTHLLSYGGDACHKLQSRIEF
jgi:hypothetical protein